MVTPGTVRSELSPHIEALIDKLNVRWVECNKYKDVTGVEFGNFQGRYNLSFDCLSVAPQSTSSRDTDYVFLHELIHWTGAANRLKRRGFSQEDSYSSQLEFEKGVHQEEAVAEFGAYLLAIEFGMDEFKARIIKDYYLKNCFFADFERAIEDAKTAVAYIKCLLNQEVRTV